MKNVKYIGMSALAAVAIMGFSGCNSSDNNDITTTPPPVTTGFVAKTPTTADSYEGVSGDDTILAASSISIGELQDRSIYPADDIDWIAVELVAGTVYEFSVSNIEETADSEVYLYDENGTEIESNDDHVDYDSNIDDFTAPYTGTYYVRPHALSDGELVSYQLGVREYVDADDDGYSPFYDVDDTNSSIEPWAVDVGGNGIDENCDGIDAIADNVADSYEDDDTFATAKPIPTTFGSMEEPHNRADVHSQMRTIHAASEVDFLEITVAPYSAGQVIEIGMGTLADSGQQTWEIFEGDGVTSVNDGMGSIWEYLENTTDTEVTFYLKVWADDGVSTGGYMPAYVSYGEDRDGDGYYTMDSSSYDPDDTNSSIIGSGGR